MLRRTLLSTAALLGVTGCSLLQGPEAPGGHGVISLRFSRGGESVRLCEPAGAPPEFYEALAAADLIQVKVYHPGSGRTPEVTTSAAIPALSDTVEMTVTVEAEENKRVAVELFEGGALTYFGVDENVDVVAGKNTTVGITTAPFAIGGFWRDSVFVGAGVPFNLIWASVPGADEYDLEMSPTPDFSSIALDTVVTDTTFFQTSMTTGDYYFRVNAQNLYTASEYVNQYVRVYGPPTITSFDPPEVARGDTVDVYGNDLDYPGTTVEIDGRACAVASGAPDQLRVVVPGDAFSGPLSAANTFGGTTTGDTLFVATILYIWRLDSQLGDMYRSMINGYGDVTRHSTVSLMSFSLVDAAPLDIFEIIIIGADTGNNPNSWMNANQPKADAVAQSGAVVLGIGTGGASYFDAVGLGLALSNTIQDYRRDIYAWDESLPIYTTPNDITFEGDGTVDVYTLDVIQHAVDEDIAALPQGMTPSALRQIAVSLFPLVEQVPLGAGALNFLWGFDSSPQNLTGEGEAILENVIKYLFDDAVTP